LKTVFSRGFIFYLAIAWLSKFLHIQVVQIKIIQIDALQGL
jgi:hypothetical protein